MTYDVPVRPGENAELQESVEGAGDGWPMWEVFVSRSYAS